MRRDGETPVRSEARAEVAERGDRRRRLVAAEVGWGTFPRVGRKAGGEESSPARVGMLGAERTEEARSGWEALNVEFEERRGKAEDDRGGEGQG